MYKSVNKYRNIKEYKNMKINSLIKIIICLCYSIT